MSMQSMRSGQTQVSQSDGTMLFPSDDVLRLPERCEELELLPSNTCTQHPSHTSDTRTMQSDKPKQHTTHTTCSSRAGV